MPQEIRLRFAQTIGYLQNWWPVAACSGLRTPGLIGTLILIDSQLAQKKKLHPPQGLGAVYVLAQLPVHPPPATTALTHPAASIFVKKKGELA